MTSSAVGPSVRPHGPTTGRTRRHDSEPDTTSAYGTRTITAAPPPAPDKPPRPLGELSTASTAEITMLAGAQCVNRNMASKTRQGMRWLLDHLAGFPGQTWQQRWEAAGLNEVGHPVADIGGDDRDRRARLNAVADLAYCMRLIQPSLAAFRATQHYRYTERFRRLADDALLEEFCSRVTQLPASLDRQKQAIFDICSALTVFGIALADLTTEALLYFVEECRRYQTTIATSHKTLGGSLAWPVLHEMGVFPAAGPASLTAARTRGQRTIEELVDRYELRNGAVRNLLVDYLHRRAVEVDYSTLDNLVRNLVGLFWKTIEDIKPDQADLRLDEATVQRWKERVAERADGKKRSWIDGIYLTVRAFYLDLHTWSAGEPERWGRWVANCPIRDTDLRQFHVRRRRLAERMANRTRQRQPLLPILSQHVNDRWNDLRTVLAAARTVGLGECFVVDGTTWQRTSTPYDREQQDRPGASIRVINRNTGELLRLSHEEHQAFLAVGGRGSAAAGRPAHRRTLRADSPQRPQLPPPQRRGRSSARGQPVQKRP